MYKKIIESNTKSKFLIHNIERNTSNANIIERYLDFNRRTYGFWTDKTFSIIRKGPFFINTPRHKAFLQFQEDGKKTKIKIDISISALPSTVICASSLIFLYQSIKYLTQYEYMPSIFHFSFFIIICWIGTYLFLDRKNKANGFLNEILKLLEIEDKLT